MTKIYLYRVLFWWRIEWVLAVSFMVRANYTFMLAIPRRRLSGKQKKGKSALRFWPNFGFLHRTPMPQNCTVICQLRTRWKQQRKHDLTKFDPRKIDSYNCLTSHCPRVKRKKNQHLIGKRIVFYLTPGFPEVIIYYLSYVHLPYAFLATST